jgi:hypothetical protein
VLTDNGVQFTFPPRYADGPTARYMTHMFDMRCRENGIEHTKAVGIGVKRTSTKVYEYAPCERSK